MKRGLVACLVTGFALASLSCGTSGGSEARPIEVLYYVSGGPGLDFEFVSDADPACGSAGVGIQSPNTDHQFGDRLFTTPHLFVLENAHQPVRAVIRNLSPSPIQVDMYLGLTQNVGGADGIINPGECRTIASGRQNFSIKQIGPEIRTEVCSATDGPSVSCLTQPPAQDRFIAFFGSTGDLVASNITNCILTPFLDACRTPATFFWQNPQDQFNAVMSVNPGQNPEGQPKATVRTELYVNGNLHETASGTEPIVGYDL
ncbi:MAG: hypothetical protein U0802_19185 [Candidatus Binatia bacterium]